ncbi:MAG: hypothetical protein ACI89D_002058 [Bermanella sp.]|jgi:hypothetical protein
MTAWSPVILLINAAYENAPCARSSLDEACWEADNLGGVAVAGIHEYDQFPVAVALGHVDVPARERNPQAVFASKQWCVGAVLIVAQTLEADDCFSRFLCRLQNCEH